MKFPSVSIVLAVAATGSRVVVDAKVPMTSAINSGAALQKPATSTGWFDIRGGSMGKPSSNDASRSQIFMNLQNISSHTHCISL